MCPTICNGERIFVEMQGGQPYTPKRGDVTVFEYGLESVNSIKRVIGLPGDIVAPGPHDAILVNGRPWQGPLICGKSLLPADTPHDSSAYLRFGWPFIRYW
jgi:signal peptidase I